MLYAPCTGEIEARRDFGSHKDVALAVRDLGRRATFAVVEFVSARPGQGVTSMFNFGKAAGVAVGALEVLEIPWVDVTPQSWQKWVKEYLGMSHREVFSSCEVALQCAPPASHGLFDRQKDHNTADAFLLALWGAAHATEKKKGASSLSLPSLNDLLVLQLGRQPELAHA